MTLWEQYNEERLLGSVLGELTGLPLTQCSEKALFGALKRHLTRRELRCWVMHEGACETKAIEDATGIAPGELEKVLQKATRKLRQPKLQQEYRDLLAAVEETNEEI